MSPSLPGCASPLSLSHSLILIQQNTHRSILSSSFISNSHTHHHESVIVLPDYKVVHDVEPTRTAVDELVERYLRPEAGRVGLDAPQSALRSWRVPFVLL